MSIEGRSIFAHAKTFVLWDSVDFPVDDDEEEIDSFYHNLISSLGKGGYYGGYYGDLCITAFGRRGRDSPEMTVESRHPRINQLGLRNRFARHNKMLMDVIRNATDRRVEPANYMLIVKGMAENQDIEFVSIVRELINSCYCNLLLVVGDKDEDMSAYPSDVLSCFTTVWTWTGLVSGGPPIIPPPPTTTEDDEMEDEDEDEDQGSSPKRQCK